MFTRTILCQCSSLVAEQVFDATQLLWQRTGSDDCTRNPFVRLYLMGIYGFAHIEVDTKT